MVIHYLGAGGGGGLVNFVGRAAILACPFGEG